MTTTILLVDDEPDLEALVAQKFRRQIREGKISFVFARDGVEAMAALANNKSIDLVVSDINMPRMDGLSLLRHLQETHDQLATIIVSAYGDIANIRTAMNRGAFDFLIKPIDFADLETTIAKTVRHLQELREARRRQVEAERAHASLSRYFSPNLAERLAGDSDSYELSGHRREVASLFTDITGFTSLVETLDPSVLSVILNDYLRRMTDVVFSHEGTVAKITGDGMHVLFGAPGDQLDYCTRAVTCALALDECAETLREDYKKQDIVFGTTRIGVHAGPAIVGNFGGGRFFDYTAYGDTINVAARLEAANKVIGTRVCVSAGVATGMASFLGRPVGDLILRGRVEPLRAHEPVSAEDFGTAETEGYIRAFRKLEARDPTAMAEFATHLGAWPGDQLASFQLKRLLNGERGTLIEIK